MYFQSTSTNLLITGLLITLPIHWSPASNFKGLSRVHYTEGLRTRLFLVMTAVSILHFSICRQCLVTLNILDATPQFGVARKFTLEKYYKQKSIEDLLSRVF